MKVELASNGWSTSAVIKVIGGARPSIIGRDLMPHLGLQLVQWKPGQDVLSIQQTVGEEGEINWRSGRTISVIYFLIFLNGWGRYRIIRGRLNFLIT